MAQGAGNSRAEKVTKGVLGAAMIDKLATREKPYEVFDTRLRGLVLRVQPSGVKTFYCVFGRGRRVRIGRADAMSTEEARQQTKQVLKVFYAGDDPIAERKQQRMKVTTFGDYIDRFYAPWALAEKRSGKATVDRLRRTFAEFGNKPIPEISVLEVDRWKSQRLKLGRKETTVNRDLVSLKAALNQAVEWGVIKVNPVQKVKKLKVDDRSRVRYLSVDEEARLRGAADQREETIRAERDSANQWRRQRKYPEMVDLRACQFVDHLKPMLLLALNTGMRRGEIFSLTWEKVNFAASIITVDGFVAKSKKTRHIPMNREVVSTLKDWKDQTDLAAGLVFPSEDGKRFDNISTAWAGLVKLAKLDGFRWHDTRHHFASQLTMAAVDLNTIRELLGHSSYEMTLRYAHLAPEHKQAAVDVLMRGRAA